MTSPPDQCFAEAALIDQLNASIQVIGVNAHAFALGATHAYRPVAVELRKLLCDTQSRKDVSLLPRCFPEIRLHVLSGSQALIDEHTVLYIPGRISFGAGATSHLDRLFNESGPMLTIADWLEQKLFSKSITLKEMVRSVADKEGAHADLLPNQALCLTKSVLFPDEDSLAAKAIVAIAQYVVRGIAIRSFNVTGGAKRIFSHAREVGFRGLVLLDLSEFCRRGVLQIQPSLVPAAEAHRLAVSADEAMDLTSLVENYDSSTTLLLVTRDFNARSYCVYGIAG